MNPHLPVVVVIASFGIQCGPDRMYIHCRIDSTQVDCITLTTSTTFVMKQTNDNVVLPHKLYC